MTASPGTCSSASQVGTATVGSGAGPQPLFLSGPVYLTGAYKGGQYGLATVVRAIAGATRYPGEAFRCPEGVAGLPFLDGRVELLDPPSPRLQRHIEALRAFHGNRQEAARALDINRTTLYKKMRKYGLLINHLIFT